MGVYKKLLEVQRQLNVPKGQRNESGNFNFRSCEDILSALKPLLAEVKATLIITDELVMQGDWHYIKATVTFIDYEKKESVSNTAYAREEQMKKGMDVCQVTGSASSYARKYALNGLFCIDDTKDADFKVFYMDDEKLETLKKELERTGVSVKSLLANYNCKMVTELSKAQYDDAIFRLELTPDKNNHQEQATPPSEVTQQMKSDTSNNQQGEIFLEVIQQVKPDKNNHQKQAEVPSKVTQQMMTDITQLVEKNASKGAKLEKILKIYQVKDVSEMTVPQYEDCKNKLLMYEQVGKKKGKIIPNSTERSKEQVAEKCC